MTGARREEELKSKPAFFKPAVDGGAKVLRHDGAVDSAHRILRQLIHLTPVPLQIQHELVDEGKRVFETVAGEALLQDLARAQQKHAQEMRQLEEDLADALRQKDEEGQRELEEERARILAEQAKLEVEKQKLLQLQIAAAQKKAAAQAQAAVAPRAAAPAPARIISPAPAPYPSLLVPALATVPASASAPASAPAPASVPTSVSASAPVPAPAPEEPTNGGENRKAHENEAMESAGCWPRFIRGKARRDSRKKAKAKSSSRSVHAKA